MTAELSALVPAFIDSSTTCTEYCEPALAPVVSHVSTQPGGFALTASVGTLPLGFAFGGMMIVPSPASPGVAKRHETAVPSGSTAGMNWVRTPAVWSWVIAGIAVIGLPLLPGERSTSAE